MVVELSYCICFFMGVHAGPLGVWGVFLHVQLHTRTLYEDTITPHTVQPLPLPLAIHCLTATMPALTVTLSANGEGSAMGASV